MATYSTQAIIEGIQRHGWLRGINVGGYLRTESGVGAGARGYVRALRSLGVPVALKDVSELCINRSGDRALTDFDTDHPYDVNLVCIDVELHFAVMAHLGEEFFRDRYNIGVWWWELPQFPQKWYDRFAYYDEIWVGTSFIANVLAPIAPIPIVRIPPVLTAGTCGSRDSGRRRLGVSPDELVYLFVFDFHSTLERKNPLALIDAFKTAFVPSDPVRLVIKCVNDGSDPEGSAAMAARAQGYPISIHKGYWTAEEMRNLMAACDAYVSLHRSEGAGLTITDAMAQGKPVIATGWSGNMDFMNVSNSFPVRYELVELKESVGPYQAGQAWAEPSVEHAAELMRRVFAHREEARARGQAARREIETHYSEEKVASLIQRRLEAIAIRRQFSLFREEMRAHFRRYQQLPERMREVVRIALPPDATVIVVSKGDNELLELDGRTAWHFPQGADGAYAGYYPANSTEAIARLEALRAKGADFLLFPSTALWWLEYYGEFKQHLERRYRVVVCQEDACVIFRLCEPGTGACNKAG